MESDIIEKIERRLPTLSKSQRRVADFILRQPMQAAFSTVDEMAQAVGTSTTTVVRLALALGYSGYGELQRGLEGYLKDKASPSTRLALSIRNGGAHNDVVADIAGKQLENVEATYKNLSDESVFLAAEKIAAARLVYVFGQRSCYGIAHYLAYNINRILGNCDFVFNGGAEAAELLRRLGEGDAVVVMSMPRYIKNVVNFARQARGRGAFVIAISDGYVSPFVPVSDVLFVAEAGSSDFHNSMTSSLFVADTLIGVLARMNHERAKGNLAEAETLLREMDVHLR